MFFTAMSARVSAGFVYVTTGNFTRNLHTHDCRFYFLILILKLNINEEKKNTQYYKCYKYIGTNKILKVMVIPKKLRCKFEK